MNIEEKCELLGRRLKEARLEKNMTQRELSKILGMSRGRIVEAEKGLATVGTVLKILTFFKREGDLDVLISEEPSSQIAALKRSKKLRERASGKQACMGDSIEND
ncbi:MAG: helix-turn-helix transcriptional regulator [Cellvibrio sp.]|uniref:helix-turn-helix transcriptional regulator n=1 Tax=Cellvibrio sp. TaxID=1965322 RepID=UPI0031AF5B6F